MLSERMPGNFSITNGFVLEVTEEYGEILSKQQDIIIWEFGE